MEPSSKGPAAGGLSLKDTPSQTEASRDVACTGCLKLFRAEEVTTVGDRNLCRECQESFQAKGQRPPAPVAGPSCGVPARKARMDYAGFWLRLGAYVVDVFLLLLVWHFVLSPVFMKIASRMMTDTTVPLAFNMPQDPSLTDQAQMEEMMNRMQDSMNEVQTRMITWVWTFNFVGMLIMAGYFIVLEGGSGQTVGKKALNIRVLTADGDSIGYLKAFARYIGRIISAVILGIGFIMIAFDGEKRALHDRMIDSRVMKE